MGTTVFTLLGQFVTYNPSGKYNKSIVLVNDVTTPTRLNALNFSPPVINIDSGITIAFWVKFQQIGSGTQTLFNFGGPGTGGGSTIIFSLYNPGTVSMWYKDTSYYTISTSTLVINTWYHLCISVGSGNLSAYLNGTSLDSKTYTPSNQTITYFSMGAYNGAGTPSSAEYDDLRIYNTALTSSQVQSIYRAQGMPSRGRIGPSNYITSATGGNTVQDIGGYRIHAFTTVGTSTFTPASAGLVEVLVVAGGGGGGGNNGSYYAGGGGGAGEVYYTASFPVTSSVSVTVGSGGTGGSVDSSRPGNNGGGSVFGSISCNGGGGGGGGGENSAKNGGSGGGAGSRFSGSITGGASVKTAGGFGNKGGDNITGTISAAGGGGAGGSGTDGGASGSTPVPGGPGTAVSISGESVTYAAGGGGGAKNGTYTPLTGTANRGGGGGGAPTGTVLAVTGGAGGSGIVIVRYPISSSMSGAPLFNQLSSSAASSAVGAFSLRAVNGVSARAVQVRNGTTSATQDFYADERGNLLTAPVVGTSLQNWLGGATGYVTTWYDQSGRGNDASQNTAANQPIIQRATKGPGYMVNFNGSSQYVTLSASYNFLNGTNITVNAVALRTATATGPNYIIGTNSPTVNYQRFFLGFGSSDTSIVMPVTSAPTAITIPAYNSSNEPVYYMTGGLTPSRVLYQNDTLGGTNTNVGTLSVPSGYSYSIGYSVGADTYYYQGNLFELLIFTSALSQTQVTQVYQNQLSYTGS
jgi:hypothetical protein